MRRITIEAIAIGDSGSDDEGDGFELTNPRPWAKWQGNQGAAAKVRQTQLLTALDSDPYQLELIDGNGDKSRGEF